MTTCELSDLPVEMCGCRIHAPHADEPQPLGDLNDVGPPFKARYQTRCRRCGSPILVGHIARAVEGGYAHEDCI